MEIGQFLTIEQKLGLSHEQIQSLEVLMMGNMELNQFLEKEYMENPLLESCGKHQVMGLYENKQEWTDIPEQKPECISDYVKSQLDMKAYTGKEWRTIEFLTECLDDNGFFKIPVSDVAFLTGGSESLIRSCLEELKRLEPAGIFSSSLEECLLLQLKAQNIKDHALEEIIRHHLLDVANGRINHISRTLKISAKMVRKYTEIIAGLNPRPLSGFNTEKTEYIVPDIIVEKEKEKWEIRLNDEWMDDYCLSDYYLKMYWESQDDIVKEYFKNKLLRARFIMESINQRRKTILDVTGEIVKIQSGYIEGQSELNPLTMSDIASALCISTSTVSRAVKNKYIQFPSGTLLLKKLFSGDIGMDREQPVTSSYVKKMLKQIIHTEDTLKPYSDKKLEEMLADREIHVSRRVIAKYRSELGIKNSSGRKTV